ncbi:MAG: hypothetical protein AB1728_09890 [Bacteroidota bacterium]
MTNSDLKYIITEIKVPRITTDLTEDADAVSVNMDNVPQKNRTVGVYEKTAYKKSGIIENRYPETIDVFSEKWHLVNV